MEPLLNYNFKITDIQDKDFAALYSTRRRDAGFAFVFKDTTGIYALRDHLGVCPLWYTSDQNGIAFATNLADLPHGHEYAEVGLRSYLGFGTTKLSPLFSNVSLIPPGTVVHFDHSGVKTIVYEYIVKPHPHALFQSFSSCVKKLDSLLKTAIQKQVATPSKAVGLCLSGGIDSGLIGLYLKELGVPTITFSALTRGEKSSERPFLDKNLQLINPITSHIDTPEYSYEELSRDVISLYRQPHGNTTAFAICNLWNNTPMRDMQCIFFGQNSDVINNAMDNGHIATFGHFLPRQLRGISSSKTMFDAYVRNCTQGMLDNDPSNLHERYTARSYTNFQLLALAGMFLRRTPVDSEVLGQPAINAGIPIGNPYYDMDVVEFLLGLRLLHKIRIGKSLRVPLSLDKRVLQTLAIQKGIPHEMAYRKKGFTVSRTKSHQSFFDALPHEFNGLPCTTLDQRFAAHMLQIYMERQ